MKICGCLLVGIFVSLVITAGCTDIAPSSAPTGMGPSPSIPAMASVSPPVADTTGCAADVCRAVPSHSPATTERSIRIEASPQLYSPYMSSTPGIALTLNTSGFNATSANYTWNTSYGRFLGWDAPDYTVRHLEKPVKNGGGNVYWTFNDKPVSTEEPVLITVTAKDAVTGNVIASSTLTLAWDGDMVVTVRDIS